MKLYSLRGNVNGTAKTFSKQFKSRDEAVNYFFNYSRKKLVFGLEIEEIVEIDSKHNLEYVCNHNSSFIVNRIHA